MYKKDIKLFLILIPLINVLTYYLTYSRISFSWHTAITFTVDTLEGYLAWLGVRWMVRLLDTRVSLVSHPIKRILTQLLMTTAIGLLVIIALTELLNYIFNSKPIPPSFYTEDVFIISIWFFVVNGIYVGLYYFDLWQQLYKEKNDLSKTNTPVQADVLLVKLGKKTRVIEYENISGILIEGEYAFVYTMNNEKHILDTSLDKIEKILPSELFFRINRQTLVHRQIIKSYNRIENGKIKVFFKVISGFILSAQLSRTKSPEFKQWLKGRIFDTQDQAMVQTTI
jgi:hypothetical protein